MAEGTQISINLLIQLALIVMGLWGFAKIVMEIINSITARHDREKAWDKAVEDVLKEREQITTQFNDRLDTLDAKIDENHTESEAKMQEITSIIIMLTKSVKAILDGQVEQGLNGEVKKQRDELNEYLTNLIAR